MDTAAQVVSEEQFGAVRNMGMCGWNRLAEKKRKLLWGSTEGHVLFGLSRQQN